MGPKFEIKVSSDGRILVRTSDTPEGEWCVFDAEVSLKVSHEVIAGQTAKSMTDVVE